MIEPAFAFVLGVAFGMIIIGFCAIGSFDRGSDSMRRRSSSRELAARAQAVRVLAERTARGAKAADRGFAAPGAFPVTGAINHSRQETAAAS